MEGTKMMNSIPSTIKLLLFISEHDDRVGGGGGGGSWNRGRGRGRGKGRGFSGGAYNRARGGFKFPSRNSFKPRGGKSYGGGPNPRSRFHDDDDDMSMENDGSSYRKGGRPERQTYQPPGARRGGNRDFRGGNREFRGRGANNRHERSGGYRERGDPSTAWYKVQIPYGRKVDQEFLMENIRNLCDMPFHPLNFHYDRQDQAVFYIQGRQLSDSLRAMSGRITQPNGFRVSIRTYEGSPPPVDLDGDNIEKLKVCMSNRYKPETLSLDLSNFSFDEDLRKEGLYIPLSRDNVLSTIINIIEDNIPEVETLNLSHNGFTRLETLGKLVGKAPNLKALDLSHNQLRSDLELDRIQGLQLEDLNLEENPLCNNFKERAPYLRAIRKRFPNIQRLDGSTLAPQIGFETLETSHTLPPSQNSFFIDEASKGLVLRFLEEYFRIYDSGDRQPLLDAYHDQAAFSLVANSNKLIKGSHLPSDLRDYNQESRNLKVITAMHKRWKSMRNGKLNVVSMLCDLPKTKHDSSSMSVDISISSPTMIIFMVTGLFKEVASKAKKPPVRFFSRTFVTQPAGPGLVITNEQLNVTNPSPEMAKTFQDVPMPKLDAPTPAPTPASSPSITHHSPAPAGLTPDLQKEMVAQFSTQSGMNLVFSSRCLEENGWNYEKAAVVFTDLKAKGGIPPEAFVK